MTPALTEPDLPALLAELVERHPVPGAGLGTWSEGHVALACHGVTSVENPLPVDRRTCFQIGSISKTFTATAVMRLVSQGSVVLDDPVQAHLPELRLADDQVARAVTVAHLLNHTAGWDGSVTSGGDDPDQPLSAFVERMAGSRAAQPAGRAGGLQQRSHGAGRPTGRDGHRPALRGGAAHPAAHTAGDGPDRLHHRRSGHRAVRRGPRGRRESIDGVLAGRLGLHRAEPVPRPYDAARDGDVAGTFESSLSRLTLTTDGGEVRLLFALQPAALAEMGGEAPAFEPCTVGFLPGGRGEYVLRDGPFEGLMGSFARTPDGAVTELDFGGRWHRRRGAIDGGVTAPTR